LPIDPEFQMREKSCVIMKKADVWGTRGDDISRNIGGKKGFAVDQRKVIDLTRLLSLVRKARLDVRRLHWHKLLTVKDTGRAHAAA
jgi:hypothetical protein